MNEINNMKVAQSLYLLGIVFIFFSLIYLAFSWSAAEKELKDSKWERTVLKQVVIPKLEKELKTLKAQHDGLVAIKVDEMVERRDKEDTGYIPMALVADASKVRIQDKTTIWLDGHDPTVGDIKYCVINTRCFPCTPNGHCGFYEDHTVCPVDCEDPQIKKPPGEPWP